MIVRAYLVRIAVDQVFGRWNAPVDPTTNEFVYVPIPENRAMRPGLATPYTLVETALADFAARHPAARVADMRLPSQLESQHMHLDPDFSQLTYGDSGIRRGRSLTSLTAGDVIVFYGGLKPVATCEHRLVYALVGLYHVSEVVRAGSVNPAKWSANAHTRCTELEPSDVIIRATSSVSGRLKNCVPIGGFRDRAYRVEPNILKEWGGLSCRDGYLQRSAVLPAIVDPRRFMSWFEGQEPELIKANNP